MSEKSLTPQVPGEESQASTDVQEAEAAPAKAGKKAAVVTGLPDASSVDAKKIARAVLTKQGWVCPDKQDKKA